MYFYSICLRVLEIISHCISYKKNEHKKKLFHLFPVDENQLNDDENQINDDELQIKILYF